MNKKNAVSQGAAVRWIAALALLALPLVGSATAPDWVEKPVASWSLSPAKITRQAALFKSPVTTGIPYRYFLQKIATSKNVLILLDGGGACWDPNTCGLNPPVQPTFFPFITESVDTTTVGLLIQDPGRSKPESWRMTPAILSKTTPRFSCLTAPATCSGVTRTRAMAGHDRGQDPGPIHHRGYGNLLAVLESLWSEQNYASAPPGKVVIAGTSAGAYGAIAAFVEVEKRLPKTNKPKTLTYLIADSGNGIVVNDFLYRAINAQDSSWGVRENGGTLPDYLLDDLHEAFGLSVRIYGELTRRYPKSRFAQIQNAYDSVQVGFLNTMKYVNDPSRWVDPNYLLPSLAEWAARMRTAVNLSAAAANYRFYTAAGSEHIVLIDVPPEAQFGFCSDLFYQENSAAGVKLTDWVRDMVNTSSLWSTGQWRNATCFPHCLTATPRCPTPSP
jgi:hypothetical protein